MNTIKISNLGLKKIKCKGALAGKRLYHNMKEVAYEQCTFKLSIKITLIEHPFDNKYLLVKLKERKS